MFEQASLSTDIVVVDDTVIVIKMHYQECFPCGKYLSNLFHIFFSYFVKPFEWWASKAIGDWKGPDVGYLSAWDYFWAKADKLTWQNIPSKPRPVTLDCSLFISNLPKHLDLPRLKDVAANSTHSYLPNWAFGKPNTSDWFIPGWALLI